MKLTKVIQISFLGAVLLGCGGSGNSLQETNLVGVYLTTPSYKGCSCQITIKEDKNFDVLVTSSNSFPINLKGKLSSDNTISFSYPMWENPYGTVTIPWTGKWDPSIHEFVGAVTDGYTLEYWTASKSQP